MDPHLKEAITDIFYAWQLSAVDALRRLDQAWLTNRTLVWLRVPQNILYT